MGDREQLRQELLTIARQHQPSSGRDVSAVRKSLEAKIKDLERQQQAAAKNYTVAEDLDLRTQAEKIYGQIKAELTIAKSELQELAEHQTSDKSVEDEVESAMGLLDRLRDLTSNPALRAGIPRLVKDLDLYIGLNFAEAIKGQKRRVRRLTGGVITFGDPPRAKQIKCLPAGGTPKSGCSEVSPVSATRPVKCHPEGISSTKVNRGDRI
jgi:hypothetical protein